MTATPILDTLAAEFGIAPENVRSTLEMLDAGLGAPYIARVRRRETGELPEGVVRRIARRRTQLEELDRRRGTILRMLEARPDIAPEALDAVRTCMDRFELEDLFLPHRRPEPEVQLALDRGLGSLADLLCTPAPRGERNEPEEAHGAAHDEDEALATSAPAERSREAHDVAAERSHEAHDAPLGSEGDAHAAQEAHELHAAAAEHAAHEPQAEHEAHEAAHAGEAEGGEGAELGGEAQADLDATGAPAALAHDAQAEAAHKLEFTLALARACADYVNPGKGVHTDQEALSGAMRILSDRLGRDPRVRGLVRRMLRKHGVLSVRATVDESRLGRHRPLLKVRQPLSQLQGPRLIAIRQALKERAITTVIALEPGRVLPKLLATLCRHPRPEFRGVLELVAEQALTRRLVPTIEQDVRLELKERGDEDALRSVAQHLRQVMLAPCFGARPVAGVDVNARGDYHIAAVGPQGEALALDAQCSDPASKEAAALGAELVALLAETPVEALTVGHGKAGRAAAPRLRQALHAAGVDLPVLIVNDAGLASYANSELARSELPERSVPARMAISLARRLQDPLYELAKVDPRHLGLGSEQSLVNKAALRRGLGETVESCVALVGCELNRAPHSLLRLVPGLDEASAQKLVERRSAQAFASREDLRASGILSEAACTSAIAFLRVPESSDLLDGSSLHPEQYALAQRLIEATGSSIEDVLGRFGAAKGLRRADFEIDEHTWRDLMRELGRPGRDPRLRVFPPRLLAPDADPKSLVAGSVVEGLVSNVAGFGAFVDIGLPRDAMIHISEISERYVRDARELLSIGESVRARVLEANGPRVTLSLKHVPERERRVPAPGEERGERGERGERSGRGPRTGGGGGGGGGFEGRRGRRGEDTRQAEPALPVRAARTRRDGMVVGSGGKRFGSGGGGGARGAGGRGPGAGRGERRGGAREDEGYDAQAIRAARATVANNPFASFFKAKPKEETEPSA